MNRHYPVPRKLCGCSTRFGRRWNLDQKTTFYVVDVPVNWDIARNQRMVTNPLNILDHTRWVIRDCQPVNVFRFS
jgi:hypothetical protein